MRVVFLGSPPFAVPVFEALLESRHQVIGLVTRPDRPRGRGRKVLRSPLVERAAEHDLAVLQPQTTKDPEFVEALRALESEVLCVASYGEILRSEVLDIAPQGSLNVHASLLPRHRGASPIQAAILSGDPVTGVTIQRMVLALDEGDILHARELTIEPGETSGKLLDRLALLGGEALVEALDLLESTSAVFTPQDPERATYARKIGKAQGRIDWSQSAEQITRHVCAFTPWPGARTKLPDGRDLTLLEVFPAPGQDAQSHDAPGTLFLNGSEAFVRCGTGCIRIAELKPEGKRAMPALDFLRGARIELPLTFGNGQS